MFNTKKINFNVALFASMAFCAAPVRSFADDSLFTSRAYPIGGSGYSCVLADFDGDGVPDAAAADYYNPVLRVLRGVSGKGFGSPVTFTPHAASYSLVAADVNGDGKPDLVMTGYANHQATVSVMLNASSGGVLNFQTQVDYNVPNAGLAAVGDVNGDGKPDIVFTVPTYNEVGILLNNGAGGFGPPAYFAVGLKPYLIALGDMNGDGKLDIVTTNDDDHTVRVLKSTGNGGFTPGATVTMTAAVTALALGDVDGDGKLDILTADLTPIAPDNPGTLVRVLHNAGSGNFAAGPTFPAGSNVNIISWADADGDGRPDVTIADASSGTVSLFLNGGGGHFGSPHTISTGTVYGSLDFFDVNGDGRRDMVFLQWREIVTLAGHGNGTFDAWNLTPADHTSVVFSVGDVNNDHIPDVVTVDPQRNRIGFFTGKGDGTFLGPYYNPVGTYPTDVHIADINGDGFPDVIVTNYSDDTFTLFLTGPLGVTQSIKTVNYSGEPVNICVADCNADGKADLVYKDIASNQIVLMLGKGDGTFQSPRFISSGGVPLGLFVGDFNHDNIPDIAVSNYYANKVLILKGLGNGTFALAQTIPLLIDPAQFAVADLNGDGFPDLIMGNTRNLAVCYGQANGMLSNPSAYNFPFQFTSLAVNDMDGDGKADLLLTDTTSQAVRIFFNDGYGDFGLEQDYSTPIPAYDVAASDMDGDGKPDLVINYYTAVGVLLQKNANNVTISGTVTLEGIASNPDAPKQNILFTFLPLAGTAPVVRPMQIGPDGHFTVTNVPKAAYVAHIKGVKFLAADVLVNATNGDVNSLTAYLHTGDVDDNNVVDIEDFSFLVSSYGTSVNDGLFDFDARVDFNGDGKVDIADFALLVANYGSTGDP